APRLARWSAARGWPRWTAGRCRRSTPRHRAGGGRRRRSSFHWWCRCSCIHLRPAFGMDAQEALEVFGVQDVALDPRAERVAIARDRIPRQIEAVVALVVTVRVGRRGAARHVAYRTDDPLGQD